MCIRDRHTCLVIPFRCLNSYFTKGYIDRELLHNNKMILPILSRYTTTHQGQDLGFLVQNVMISVSEWMLGHSRLLQLAQAIVAAVFTYAGADAVFHMPMYTSPHGHRMKKVDLLRFSLVSGTSVVYISTTKHSDRTCIGEHNRSCRLRQLKKSLVGRHALTNADHCILSRKPGCCPWWVVTTLGCIWSPWRSTNMVPLLWIKEENASY